MNAYPSRIHPDFDFACNLIQLILNSIEILPHFPFVEYDVKEYLLDSNRKIL